MSCRHDTIVICTRSAFGGAQATINMCLRTAHHESAAPKLSNTDNVKGIAFVKSRRAPLNVAQMVMEMNAKTIPNGVMIDTVYADTSSEGDYDRKEIGWLFNVLKDADFKVVVVKSLNDITDDILDLEEFVRTISDMGIWLYSLEVGPVPITVSHAEEFGC